MCHAGRDELDDAFAVALAAALRRDDLETEPQRRAREPLDLAPARGRIERSLGRVGREEIVDVAAHVRGVARARQLERGSSASLTSEARIAASIGLVAVVA